MGCDRRRLLSDYRHEPEDSVSAAETLYIWATHHPSCAQTLWPLSLLPPFRGLPQLWLTTTLARRGRARTPR